MTNALGAVIGDIRVEERIQIKASYEMNSEEETKSGYFVYGGGTPELYTTYEEALARAKVLGEANGREKAVQRGATEIIGMEIREEQQNAVAYGMDLFLGSTVYVEVIGRLGFV